MRTEKMIYCEVPFPIYSMKKLLSVLCVVGILPLAAETASAAMLLRGRCDTLRGLARGRCESRMENQNQTNAQSWRELHGNLIRERKAVERLESQKRDRGMSANRSMERRRADGKENLITRRQTTRNSKQMRLEERKQRRSDQQEERNSLLRNRVMENKMNAVLDKAELRSRTRSQRDASQDRREEIKQAHKTCGALGVEERLQCLQKAREDRAN